MLRLKWFAITSPHSCFVLIVVWGSLTPLCNPEWLWNHCVAQAGLCYVPLPPLTPPSKHTEEYSPNNSWEMYVRSWEKRIQLTDGVQVANQLTLSKDIIFDNLSRLRVVLSVFPKWKRGGCQQGCGAPPSCHQPPEERELDSEKTWLLTLLHLSVIKYEMELEFIKRDFHIDSKFYG